MAAAEEIEVVMSASLRWTVDTKSDHRDAFSSEVRFKGGIWKLNYCKCGTHHSLYLFKCYGVSPNPFQVSVCVESFVDGRMVKVLSDVAWFTDEFEKEDSFCMIWFKKQQEILGSVPEFRQHGILNLRVVLKVVEDSASKLFSLPPSVHVQTTSYVPCLESLSEDFAKLLDQGPYPDIEFHCGGLSTKAHGTVVSARSQVIAKMLASDTVEGRRKVVKIPDMRPDVFEKFLKYIYTGKLDGLTFEIALKLFEAGSQYAIKGLAKRCSEYLVEHLSLENACEVLVIADAHSDEGLVEKVVDYMVDKRVPEVNENWPAFCDEHPRLANKVLSRRWKAVVK